MNIRMKLRMLETGMTNYELAKRLGCDAAKVSRVLNDWVTPDKETKGRIAAELGVSVADLWAEKAEGATE